MMTTIINRKKNRLKKFFTVNTTKNMFIINSRFVTNSITLLTRLTNSTLNFFLSKRRTLSSIVVVVTKYFHSITNFIIILSDTKSLFSN